MDNVMRILINGVAITAAVFVGYIVKSTIRGNHRPHKQTSEKVTNTLCCDVEEYPTLHNLYWKKIGQVVDLLIYPVKLSKAPVFYSSFEFRDYGMCRREFKTYFWDGMFLVYNKTMGKFEDTRRYPLLRLLRAQLTNTDEVTLSCDGISDTIKLYIDQYRNPSNRFVKKTWNRTLKPFYGSNSHVNEWLKEMIDVDEINEDLTLALMSPRKWDSTEKIKDNWCRFLQGYEAMEKDKTGKLITLPRFVLMTIKTSIALNRSCETATPNIVVNTDDESINSFEEKNWDWIKLGNDVVLKNVKPVPSFHETVEHCGIYCALWSGGNVKIRDEVYIYDPPRRPRCW